MIGQPHINDGDETPPAETEGLANDRKQVAEQNERLDDVIRRLDDIGVAAEIIRQQIDLIRASSK